MGNKQETITTSIRLTETINEYIRKKASEIGISQNALMSVLIDLGIKLYEGQVSISLHPQE